MKKLNKRYIVSFDENGGDGWAFGRPAGIETYQWPRSRVNGLPMAHLFTIRIPEEYKVKKKFDYISVFQSDDHVAVEIEGVREVIERVKLLRTQKGAFWDGLIKYARNKHKGEIYSEDLLEAGWCLVYLTKEEFNKGTCELPDEEEKPNNFEQDVINLEEKPANPEHEIEVLKDDIQQLRRRIVALEDDMKGMKEKLRKMSFSPGL